MEDRARKPLWIWLLASVLFLLFALLFQFLAGFADGWFTRLGAFAFTGVLFDMSLIFLAAFIAAGPFLWRLGASAVVRRGLTRGFIIAYGLWTAYSFLMVAGQLQFAPVVAGLGVFTLVEAALGAVLIFLAVYLCARLFGRAPFRREPSRRDEAAALS